MIKTKNIFSAAVLECIRNFPSERPQKIKMNSVAVFYGIPGHFKISHSSKHAAEKWQSPRKHIHLDLSNTLVFISLKIVPSSLH